MRGTQKSVRLDEKPCEQCGVIFVVPRFCCQGCLTSYIKAIKPGRTTHTLTAARLRQIVEYDPLTGDMIWRERKLRHGVEFADSGWNKRNAGKKLGCKHRHGHLSVHIWGKGYLVHRLAWLYVHGKWPAGNIDHINGDPSDNRIGNLRVATQKQNMQNQKLRINNTSGHKGVYFAKKDKKWVAFITDDKMRIIGRYAHKEDAVAARLREEKRIFGEFMRNPTSLAAAAT